MGGESDARLVRNVIRCALQPQIRHHPLEAGLIQIPSWWWLRAAVHQTLVPRGGAQQLPKDWNI